MKSSLSLSGMLLATTMLIAPTLANAQDADQPAATTLTITDQIIVRGRNIPEPQRATSQVATFLSPDDLERTGDSTAAEALKRLSGLSVVGGKFAFVRGLGDRYSSARLNGSALPSPEPLRRTVPLDLFPSNVLQGATVQKTFSPNYPGEFGGGIIDLQTLRDPGEGYLKVKLGVGMNTQTTAKSGIFVNGGDLDWLGYDDGLRDIPGALQGVIDSGVFLTDLDPAQREAIGESLVNSPLLVLQEGSLGPNFEGVIDGGKTWDLDSGVTLGLVGVAGYNQDWRTENSVRQFVDDNTLGADYDTTETSLDVTVNGLLSGSVAWDRNVIQATALYIHSTRKEAQIDEGFNFNAPNVGGNQDIRIESNSWLERQLWMGQLVGEHGLGNFDIDWRAAFARSTRDSPYEQSLQRNLDADGVPLFTGQGARRAINFSDLTDDNFSGGIDIAYNVPFSGPREATLSIGYEYVDNEREFNNNGFFFDGGFGPPLDVAMARPDFLFSPDNIDPARFELRDAIGQGADSYTGDLRVHAAYFLADAELIPTLRTTVGVRYETADEAVNTFDRFGGTGLVNPSLSNEYWLPSATVTWNFANDMQFRVGYSHTIARPQFRELAPSQFVDPDTDRTFRGNGFLIDSEFRNYDARYEYYLGRNQFITVGGFYKDIKNPIEEITFSPTNFRFITTFINSPKAELYGGEFEYRTRFALPVNDWFDRREWLFSVNYTFTESEISASADDIVFNPFATTPTPLSPTFIERLDGEPLQGTPKHIVNAQFGWEGDNDQLTVLIGWVSERILQRGDFGEGGGGLPNVIEHPGIQLDLTYRVDVEIQGVDFTIGLNARNLLGTEHNEFQVSDLGQTPFQLYEVGRSLSASLTANF